MTNYMTRFASTLVAASVFLVPVTPAMAHHRDYDRGYENDDRGYGYGYGYNQDRYYANQDYDRRYDNQRDYNERYNNQRSRYYRSNRCNSGTTGLVLGAIAGGLLGREVVGRHGDRTAGAIIGAGAGALGGRAIDRSGGRGC